MMQREQVDRYAQAQPRRAFRDRGELEQWRRHHRETRREMDLGQPQRVEAEPVGLHRFSHQLAVTYSRVLRVRRRQLVEEVKFHSMHPMFSIRRAQPRVRDGRPASRRTIH